MNRAFVKKYSLDILVLFGLLILSLGVAVYVADRDYKVKIDKGLELEYAGFSASLPQGFGWEARTQRWQYKNGDNLFFISAFLREDNRQKAAVQWRYLIDLKPDVDVLLNDKIVQFSGTVKDRGEKVFNGITLKWVNYSVITKGLNVYYAAAQLPLGRTVELEIRVKNDSRLANELFDKVSPTLYYSSCDLLKRGMKLVSFCKQLNTPDLDKQKREDYYLYRNMGGIIGLSADVTSLGHIDEKPVISIEKFSYLSKNELWINKFQSFRADESLSNFLWQYQSDGNEGHSKKATILTLNSYKDLMIKDVINGESRNLTLGLAAYPEIMQHFLFKGFINMGVDECMVDMVISTGDLVPVILRKGQSMGSSACIEIKYLNGIDMIEKVYVDKRGVVNHREAMNNSQFIILKSTKSQVLKHFASFENYINQIISE